MTTRILSRVAARSRRATSSTSPTAAAVAADTVEIQHHGFEVARSAVPAAVCEALRSEALYEADAQAHSFTVALTRALGLDRPLREASRREHVTLRFSLAAASALRACFAAGDGRLAGAASRAGLSPRAELIELSAMVVWPGAKRQQAHTDVPPCAPQGTATLWCALQPTDESMGPLAVHPASPCEMARRYDWEALQQLAYAEAFGLTFSPDGEPHPPLAVAVAPTAARPLPPATLAGFALPGPIRVTMGVGDAALMDSRAFHFGNANTSSAADPVRAHLCATFREPRADDETGVGLHDGFRSVLRRELAGGKHQLAEFLSPEAVLEPRD